MRTHKEENEILRRELRYAYVLLFVLIPPSLVGLFDLFRCVIRLAKEYGWLNG